MVSTETRNNYIVAVTVIAFSIMVAAFASILSNNLTKTSDDGMRVVKIAADNVTSSTHELFTVVKLQGDIFNEGFTNLTKILNKQYNLTLLQQQQNAKNLGIFVKASQNQTQQLVNAIEEQKQVFVDTLSKSQNLTKQSQNLTKDNQRIGLVNQNLTEQRNYLLQLQIQQFDDLLSNLNKSYVPLYNASLYGNLTK